MTRTRPLFNVLLSFAYHGGRPVRFFLEHTFGSDTARWPKVILDSGAVTVDAQGKQMNIRKYAHWVRQAVADDCVLAAANLDVIRDPVASAVNLQRLHDLGVDAMPVVHNGTPGKVIDQVIEATSRVGIGGMTRQGTPKTAAIPYLVHCFAAAQRYGTLTHGFGMTRQDWIARFPWTSVDSSTWSGAHRFGKMLLFDGVKMHTYHWTEANKYGPLVEAHGGDPNDLIESYHYKKVAAITGVAWVKWERALQTNRPDFTLHLVDSNDRTLYFVRKNLERLDRAAVTTREK